MSNIVDLPLGTAIPGFELPHRLDRALEHAGKMKAEQMAEALEVSPATIRNYISGRTTPQTATIREWARITGVSYQWLLTGDDPRRGEGPDPDGVGTSDECVPRGSNPDPSDSRSATVTSINTAKPRHALPQAA